MPSLTCNRIPALKNSSPLANSDRFVLGRANSNDRKAIYRMRHEIYACEIHQHSANGEGLLRDALDDCNQYLVAKFAGELCGFVSITSPGQYSLLKYFPDPPLELDDATYEIRLLSVRKPYRNTEAALLLTYAAFRWVQAHGGKQIVAIGRREIIGFYERLGLKRLGLSAQSGAVSYELLRAEVDQLDHHIGTMGDLRDRLKQKCKWQFSFGFDQPANCFHGGQFFDAIGPRFGHLERSETVINADVLDAWFSPSPRVLYALDRYLPWVARTSPPAGCEGFLESVAEHRGVAPLNILPGSGSSDLIFRALRHWLTRSSKVLLLDPTYGEYAHVLERVIGCQVHRLQLFRANQYEVDLKRLEAAFSHDFDLVILVNPNSPTGRPIPRKLIEPLLARSNPEMRIWIDETYIEYAGTEESLEQMAARSENVIVCKSMSKVYALSGMRAAYLCAGAHQLEELRAITPPWVMSLPAQIAAVAALDDPTYYRACYEQTHCLRKQLADALRTFQWDVIEGCANFLLCHLPANGPTAAEVVKACQKRGLFLRDASNMGAGLGPRALRVAVKDPGTQKRMISILEAVLR